MKTITPWTVVRIVVQLALAGGVIVCAPFALWAMTQLPHAIMDHDWTEVSMAPKLVFGFIGIVALCVSIGTSRQFAAQRPGFRWVLFSGLGSGLIVAGYILVQMAVWYMTLGTLSSQGLYLTAGPTVVAVWNIVRLSGRANYTADQIPRSHPSQESGDL